MHIPLETKQMINNKSVLFSFMLLPCLLLSLCSRMLYSELIIVVAQNSNQQSLDARRELEEK